MSLVRQQLLAQLARFDEEAFVALANRGLYRRALKDLEKQAGAVTEDTGESLTVTVAGHQIRFDARGPAHARCSCPASGVCQHILAAAITLQRLGAEVSADADESETPQDIIAPLRDALLAMSAKTLIQHAGKAGYRWAWQFVADASSAGNPLKIAGETHLVLSFQRPRISLRFMGGGIENMLADSDIAQVEKYRVAAILAFQQAHGQALTPPEATANQRNEALDLGKDHALADTPAAIAHDSRERLRTAVLQLIGECMELGLAHLSRGIHERFSTLAVWAQGAEYHRLALMLRRLADHVELLLERAGGADEHVLFDELTLAYGLVSALASSAARGAAPARLLGRSRSSYEAAGTMELLGLGATAWRSGSGYHGLTMLFWSPAEQSFFSYSDARPEAQRGFNPIARYMAAGPWSGLGAPAMATGRRLTLTSAQVNDAGRLSAAGGTSATLMPEMSPAEFSAALRPHTSWSALAQMRSDSQRSLLAEAQAMKEWVALQPARFGSVRFDATRQVLIWHLHDAQELVLDAELAYSDFTSHAIGRIESLRPAQLAEGTLLIARMRGGADRLVLEPLSLVCMGGQRNPPIVVDALHFDPAPEQGRVSKWLETLRSKSRVDASPLEQLSAASSPPILNEFRRALQRQAERGISSIRAEQWIEELKALAARAGELGFTSFSAAIAASPDPVVATLRANYLCQQFERMIVGAEETQV